MPEIDLPADGEKPYGTKLRTAINAVNDAVDAATEAIADGSAVTDSAVTALVANPASDTRAELNNAIAGIAAPVVLGKSVADFGASPSATAAQNVTALRAAVEWARTNALGVRALFVPACAASEQYLLNDDVKVTGQVKITGAGVLSRIKQTVRTKPVFRACDRGQYYADLHFIGADDRDTIPDGGGTDLIRDNHPFANHCGIAFQYGSDGSTAERITGENIAIVVGFWGWSDDANDYGGYIKGLTLRDISGTDVWCVVFGRECDSASIDGVSGTYKRISTIFADPHGIYLTSSNYVSTLRPLHNVNVNDLRFYDSVGGEPIALKNIYGGSVSGINVRNTPGIGVFAEVDNFTIGAYVADEIWKDPTSVGTANSPSGGQVGMLTFSACKNVTVAPGSRQKNKAGNQAKSIVFTGTANEDVTIFAPDITTNHATEDLADNRAEVYVYGTNVQVVRPAIKMRGAARHGIRMGGASPSVVDPEIRGCGQAIITDAAVDAKIFDYNPAKITRAVATLPPLRVNASGDSLAEVLSQPPRAIVWDRGYAGSPSGRLIQVSSGHKPTLYGSAWQVGTDGRWNALSASATLPRYAVFDAASADVAVESDVWLGVIDSGGSGTYSVGHALRAVTEYINLLVELRSDRLTVTYRSGTSGLTLASVASVLGTYAIGRKYRLRSAVFGDNVQVFVDGVKIIDATLTSDQMTALGTATLHGITERQSLASKWADFRVFSLAA